MKKIMLVAAMVGIAACSQADNAPAPDATEEAAEAAPANIAADGLPSEGTYKVTLADGSVQMEELKADGTYVATVDGKVVESGTWEQKAPETYCYTTDEEGAEQVCNAESVGADGVWTSTNPDGETATVERVEAEAAAE
ncbi:hypothetical protein [Altererythrobacter sp.]|uniref:hypothetical protein n=1 Tax=Altererythrobacter sp. TaxID=1872480 RepID=UPI003D0F293A